MRIFFFAALTLAALTACKGGIDTADTEDTADSIDTADSSNELGPLTLSPIFALPWDRDRFPNGYAVAGTPGGLLTTSPGEEVVLRVPWTAPDGSYIEDVSAVVATYPGGADALRSLPGGGVNLAFGVMGAGLAAYYPEGVDGLQAVDADQAPIVIRGTIEEGYTGRTFIEDFDGDDHDDLAVVEGSVPGNVRIFLDVASMAGEYDADAADITIETCADSSDYGPTYVQRFGAFVAVGCASRDYRDGLTYVFAWPLSDGSTDIGYQPETGGWYGASLGADAALYSDVRGGGAIAITMPDGNGRYVYPPDASIDFGASPSIAEHAGRVYLAIGDQGWQDAEGNTSGRVTVCDITEEPTPIGDWFADCIHASPPTDDWYMGAAVDLDSIDIDGDGAAELVLTASGWQYGGTAAPGVAAWRVER